MLRMTHWIEACDGLQDARMLSSMLVQFIEQINRTHTNVLSLAWFHANVIELLESIEEIFLLLQAGNYLSVYLFVQLEYLREKYWEIIARICTRSDCLCGENSVLLQELESYSVQLIKEINLEIKVIVKKYGKQS